jgi:predicted O-methyltransferase YrrM
MNDWKNFYNAIRDSSWPDCDKINDFVTLPSVIQLEIIQDHLFNEKHSILANKIRNTHTKSPNFLIHINEIKQIIGPTDALMNSQDAVFLYSLIWSKTPKNVLEIGRWHGWSSAIIFGALEDAGIGHLYTVDITDRTNTIIKSVIESRTTFITASSANILSLDALTQLQFEVVFIDGDHSYSSTLIDLKNTYKILTAEAWILVHDDDMPEVRNAINTFLSQVDNVIDCGCYGEKIRLLYKKDCK